MRGVISSQMAENGYLPEEIDAFWQIDGEEFLFTFTKDHTVMGTWSIPREGLKMTNSHRIGKNGEWCPLYQDWPIHQLRGCTPRGRDNPYPLRRAAGENWRGRYLTTE
jgi:hypothetical protein